MRFQNEIKKKFIYPALKKEQKTQLDINFQIDLLCEWYNLIN